jgi:STAS domain
MSDRGNRLPVEPLLEMLVMPSAPSRADVESMLDDVRELAGCVGSPMCDVGEVAEPDADTIDALARLQLLALRVGVRFRFSSASDELRDLLALTGLADVLPCEQAPCDPPRRAASGGSNSSAEPLRQAEQREHALRVEEERDPGDPLA